MAWVMDHSRLLLAAIVALFHLLGILSSILAITSSRTSPGAIAWAVSLNTFPYLAVPAYWIFGRNKFMGYVVARRQADSQNRAIADTVTASLKGYRIPSEDLVGTALAAERLAGLPVLGGNRVDLLVDGTPTFDSILEGIEQAEHYILVQFYIVRHDGLGTALKQRLLARARQGVPVYFLYDEIGSYELSAEFCDELTQAGVRIHPFNTRKGRRNRFQLNFRNHRKIVVVDGRIAWIGGHNVGDEYLGKSPRFGRWRDTHLRIEGPAVLEAQISFVEDWFWTTEEQIELCWQAQPNAAGDDANVLILPSGPADQLDTATLMFVQAIHMAEQRIWITSPYFVPDEAVIVALQLAGLRGVDVRILIPDRPDHLLVYLAAYTYFEEAGRTGIKFYRYTAGFLHGKVVLIDDEVATVGTVNLDNRSLRLNFEITAIVADPKFVSQVKAMLEDDFANSRRMDPDELSHKPWLFQIGARLARLMAPIL